MCVMPAAISDVSVVSKDTNFVRLFKLQKYRLRQHPFGLGKRFQVLKCKKKQWGYKLSETTFVISVICSI